MAGADRSEDIARVYAQALFRLAEERGEAEGLLAELDGLVAWTEAHDREAAAFLSPLADSAARRGAIERAFRDRASDLFVDALQVLNARGRLPLLREVAAAFRDAFQRARRLLDLHVASAVPLSETQRARLRELTRSLTGFEARILERVEPELLGGLVVRARDRKFDNSLRTRLARLHGRLAERASQEILQARGRAS